MSERGRNIMKKVLFYLFILICILGGVSSSYADYGGTIGTRFTIAGSGFGYYKSKVYLLNGTKQVQAKIESWSDTSITCLWNKKISPGTYPLLVQPKGKWVSPVSAGSFAIMLPIIDQVTPENGASGDVITVNGRYFTNKKPKVYFEDPNTHKRKSCKVLSSSMNPETGSSTLQFLMPKWGLGSYNIILINTIGQTSTLPISPPGTYKLPDTGQTVCYNTSTGNVIACSPPGNPLAQDGSYNINPLSYTNIGTDTVTDNNTGLMWQKYEYASTYNWYEASGTYDAAFNPSSQNVCGSLNLGGYSDWRLPTKKDLMSIVDYSIPYPGPAINTTYFPNTHVNGYWSSTAGVGNPNQVWAVDFGDGSVSFSGKDYVMHVRCVRGEQVEFGNFKDNLNGTVTDNLTGLMWQQGEPQSMTWDSALSYCEGMNFVGLSDWRLANIKELESITDDGRYNLAIDPTFFPNAYANYYYWSSTTNAGGPSDAWVVDFYYGYIHGYVKIGSMHFRCVRGGW